MNINQDLVKRVRNALRAAGETECRVRVNRRGMTKYLPDYDGFRLYVTPDRPLLLSENPETGVAYLGVGHRDNLRKHLRRYEGVLRAAGIPVVVCGLQTRKSTVRVWVNDPWPTVDPEPADPEPTAP